MAPVAIQNLERLLSGPVPLGEDDVALQSVDARRYVDGAVYRAREHKDNETASSLQNFFIRPPRFILRITRPAPAAGDDVKCQHTTYECQSVFAIDSNMNGLQSDEGATGCIPGNLWEASRYDHPEFYNRIVGIFGNEKWFDGPVVDILHSANYGDTGGHLSRGYHVITVYYLHYIWRVRHEKDYSGRSYPHGTDNVV